MQLAVMQPYLFPYIGYFQLIYAADIFLIYDDVSYIKQGYINRNRVLSSTGEIRFTVPVPGASSNRLISDLKFSADVGKVLKTIEQSYSKAPYFKTVFPLIRQCMEHDDRRIASVCLKSFEAIFAYIGLKKEIKKTSEIDYERSQSALDRLIELCCKFETDSYINAPGGRSLYNKSDFATHGIELKFIDSYPVEYRQGSNEFIPNLSIIDLLMNCSSEEVVTLLGEYELN
ncbi:WbqC family protein [Amphritea pacifica]|uniref:WbqC family protein n=1 Tax=Amphritea pacifica TaxID=2811233 RepID=UPI001964106D|nr:WbqC family protein [Amphritea pacifica]MBN1005314.1 WbqC family protein [Amphritea pacifica]